MFRNKPAWTVSWPTLPDGMYSIPIADAASIDDAVAQARAADAPCSPGYSIDYGREPEVWQIKPGPARRVAGPNWADIVPRARD